ncbi:MAG: hypothetical protein H7Y14_09745 [Burkholderiales bacterium]|nr:hypothetical protein [Burkholderiales bacterium]
MNAPLASQRVPAERSAPPRELEVRPKQAKAWIESLPLGQSVETARKMSAHLSGLNRAKIPPEDRVQILDTYRPFAGTVLEELEAVFGKSSMPLGPRGREALTAARTLASHLSAGYRIALTEKTGKLIAFGAKKQLPALALRAMEYLGTELRASYKAYSPVPQGLWQDMHKLYVYADGEGVAAEAGDAETKATVHDVYCEALLLSLTDPYRLPPGEADKIVAQIRGVRSLATLGRKRPATKPGGHFIVPCDTDRGPKPALSANDDNGGPNWRLLDTNPIVDKLRTRKQAIETGNVSATMSKSVSPDALALMGRLATLWGDPPKRAHRRDPMDTTVAICVGLKSISHFVAHEPRIDTKAEAAAIKSGITIPLMAVPDDETSKQFPVFEWQVVNLSAGGAKMHRTGAALQPVGIGDVVGLKFMDKGRWAIGVARWITQLDDGGMEFGVQFLAFSARPVWLNPTNAGNPQMKQGLVFEGGDGEEAALLTPPNLYEDLRIFALDDAGDRWEVRASNLIEKTTRFDLFHVSAS